MRAKQYFTVEEQLKARRERQKRYYQRNKEAKKQSVKAYYHNNKSRKAEPLPVPSEYWEAVDKAEQSRQQKKHQDVIQSCVVNGNKDIVLRDFDKEFGT